MTQPIPPPQQARYFVLPAETMLDLINKMITHAPPLARLIYFGRNEGDYSQDEFKDIIDKAKYIAVYDHAPMYVVDMGNVHIITNQATLNVDSDKYKKVNAA